MHAVLLLALTSLQHFGPALDAPPPAALVVPATFLAAQDTGRRTRPRAIEYSDFYGVRLEIHRAASYATLPLFIGEFALGQSLYNHPPARLPRSRLIRSRHSAWPACSA